MSAVFEAWIDAIAEQASRAVDRDAVLEALASVHALGLVSDLLDIDVLGDRARFSAVRARARLLLGTRPTATRVGRVSDAERGRAQAEAWARAGLTRLEGKKTTPTEARARATKRVPEASLLRLVRGQLDGFRAAEVARELSSDPASVMELRLLLGLPLPMGGARRDGAVSQATPLRLAAEGPTTLRDPALGTVVGQAVVGQAVVGQAVVGPAKRGPVGTVALEAVRFADGVVAIYASQPLALGLPPAASKKTTKARVVGAAPGYLELSGTAAGRLRLHLEGKPIELSLDAEPR